MNLNEDVINKNRVQNRTILNKTAINRKTQFGKPQPPKLGKKTVKSSTTSSSTHINWGVQRNSVYSSTLNTGSSSRTTTTSADENQIILALTEGRGNATCEIGMAVVNLTRPSIILCQISDTQSYMNTLTKINILNPTEIIVPMTFIEGRFQSRVLGKIQQQFNYIRVTGFARSAFNKADGMDRIRNLCLPQYNFVLLSLQHKYYCLSAAAALLLYIESIRNVYYARESVKVSYEESEGSMIIDISSADKLELVINERTLEPGQKSTLLSTLNYCLTRIGNRTLRALILQPPCSVPDIEARLDCVTELIKKPQMLGAIQAILIKLSNIDQILSLATILPDSLKSYTERQLNYILLLNIILDQIVPLKEICDETEQQFFLELRETLSSDRFANLKELLAKTIKSDAYPTKGSNATMQRCFAIKPGVNSLLDAVRKTYTELLDEMRMYVEDLAKKYGMSLTLANNNKKGFHIVLTLTPQQKKTLKKSDLPHEFTQVCRLLGSFTMKTEELTTYGIRIEDVTANILQISNGIIRGLLMETKNYLDIFYKLVEDIAKLDILQSLAEANSGNSYVRPYFADYTDISNAKHPMLDMLCSKEPVANPIQVSNEYNMHIITGPNGSGKSIYIKQVALIQIMAQIGSYVPATNATLRVCDRLFTRINLDDNLECNISTFELELLEIKHFLTTLTARSLIIIDELCRSTAVEEGTALAMAICEKMLMTPAFIFFTTHYTVITRLQELYCNVKVWQMEANVIGTDIANTKLEHKYNLIPGCTSLKRYSIYLIAKVWPSDLVQYIESILENLSRTKGVQTLKTNGVSAKTKIIYEVKSELALLKKKKQLTKAAINTVLNKYQRQLQDLGVKVVHEETSENEQQTVSATQVTYNYIPDALDESSDKNYEELYGNWKNLNYLIPDVSLREDSQQELQFICTQSEHESSGESLIQRSKQSPISLNQSNILQYSLRSANILSQEVFEKSTSEKEALSENFFDHKNFNFLEVAREQPPFIHQNTSGYSRPFSFSTEINLSHQSLSLSPLKEIYPSPQITYDSLSNLYADAPQNENDSVLPTNFSLPKKITVERSTLPLQEFNANHTSNEVSVNRTKLNEELQKLKQVANNEPVSDIVRSRSSQSTSFSEPISKSVLHFLKKQAELKASSLHKQTKGNFNTNFNNKISLASKTSYATTIATSTTSLQNPNKDQRSVNQFANKLNKSVPIFSTKKTTTAKNSVSVSFCDVKSAAPANESGQKVTSTNQVANVCQKASKASISFKEQTESLLNFSPDCQHTNRKDKNVYDSSISSKTCHSDNPIIDLARKINKSQERSVINKSTHETSKLVANSLQEETYSFIDNSMSAKLKSTHQEASTSSKHQAKPKKTCLQIEHSEEIAPKSEFVHETLAPSTTMSFSILQRSLEKSLLNVSPNQVTPTSTSSSKRVHETSITTSHIASTPTPKKSNCVNNSLTTSKIQTSIVQQPSTSFFNQRQLSTEHFSHVLTPQALTPNKDISFASSTDCSKFIAGVVITSTPLLQRTTDTYESFNDYSVSYSPLCSSPTKIISLTNKNPRKRLNTAHKFIPPNKLTKREIERDFAEQTRKMMESSDSSKVSDYARQICNRPTVKQLQESEHIVSIKRTEDGVVVIPVKESKNKQRRHFNFNAPYKTIFEPNLLSDANEERFLEFLERSKKSVEAENNSGNSSRLTTPSGYYKENKLEIEAVINKYLKQKDEEEE